MGLRSTKECSIVLPLDIWTLLVTHLGYADHVRVTMVCKRFRERFRVPRSKLLRSKLAELPISFIKSSIVRDLRDVHCRYYEMVERLLIIIDPGQGSFIDRSKMRLTLRPNPKFSYNYILFQAIFLSSRLGTLDFGGISLQFQKQLNENVDVAVKLGLIDISDPHIVRSGWLCPAAKTDNPTQLRLRFEPF